MSGCGIIRVRKWRETSMSTERSAQKLSRHNFHKLERQCLPLFKWNKGFMDAKRACVCTTLENQFISTKVLQIFAHFCIRPLIFCIECPKTPTKNRNMTKKASPKTSRMGKKGHKMAPNMWQKRSQNDAKMRPK